MDPYAKTNEHKTGVNRPKVSHLPSAIDHRTPNQRRAEKQAVKDERRAIKKAMRQQLKQKMLDDLSEIR